MTSKKKFIAMIAIGSIVTVAVAATTSPQEGFKNLKVLPKNIDSKTLSKIMVDDFTDGLGVSCSFCHAEEKNSHRLDYASDEKPEKQVARIMMRMTLGINRKYFKLKHAELGNPMLEIKCESCHKGQPHPGLEDR
jgi:hypothetical protein